MTDTDKLYKIKPLEWTEERDSHQRCAIAAEAKVAELETEVTALKDVLRRALDIALGAKP